jgi:hypothetical protein
MVRAGCCLATDTGTCASLVLSHAFCWGVELLAALMVSDVHSGHLGPPILFVDMYAAALPECKRITRRPTQLFQAPCALDRVRLPGDLECSGSS